MNKRMDMILPYGMQPGDDATSVILELLHVQLMVKELQEAMVVPMMQITVAIYSTEL